MSQSIVNEAVGLPPGIGPFDPTPDFDLGPGHGLIPNAFNVGGEFDEPAVNSAAVVALPLMVAAAPAVVGGTVQAVGRGVQLTRAGVLAADRAVKLTAAANPNALSFGGGFTKGVAESFRAGSKGVFSPVTPGLPRSAQVGKKFGQIVGQVGGMLFRAGLLPGQ